jgi:glycosyltransferase involved in cell wall biosynthesis
MRVAVLTHTFFPIVGGAEVGIHEIYERFVGDDVTIVTPISADYADAFSAGDDRPDPRYKIVRYTRRRSQVKNARLRKAIDLSGFYEFRILRAMHRRERLDAINIHFVAPFGLVALWSRIFLRVPVTISLIGRTDVWEKMTPSFRRQARLALRASAAYTEITRYCLAGSDLAGAAIPLPYGVDARTYTPDRRSEAIRASFGAKPGQTVLFAAQRLSPPKRVDLLIDVAQKLEAIEPGAYHLVIVGKGSESPRLEAKIAAAGIGNVVLAGYVSENDLPNWYASSDIFVSHSMFETFGVMFAEAMASGLPIVAAATSSVPMVVTDGENGSLIAPLDVDGFVAAIRDLRADPVRAASIGMVNRAKAENEFNWDTIALTLRNLFLSQSKARR